MCFFLITPFAVNANDDFTSQSIQSLQAVDYDIVYVRQPRYGEEQQIKWPEAWNPAKVEPGSDLILLHPDGSEEVLVDTEFGAVTDPFISFDAKWVFYSFFPDVRKESLNRQRSHFPKAGADIYKMNLKTREISRLTFQEFTPNTGSGNWDESDPVSPEKGKNALGYGILNMGPAPVAGGKIVFTSNRNGFQPTKSFTTTTMQLYIMDEDGKNVTAIAPMTLGSALHPTSLTDGRILFSSYESQGLRDRRLWGLWAINPDGRKWEPVVSAFGHASVFHFATQLSNGNIVAEDYYNKNNYGFGTLYGFPVIDQPDIPRFSSALKSENPEIEETINGRHTSFKMAFSPKDIYSVTPSATSRDRAASPGQGKYTHPSAAPNNDLLVVWSDGPVNALNRPSRLPAVDSGIYVIPNTDLVYDSSQLVKIKNNPKYNEAWPRAVVSYKAIHGIREPKQLDWLPNNGQLHAQLPEGTPFGLIGTSSFYNRETTPGVAEPEKKAFGSLDAFNTSSNGQSSNWILQGADAGIYNNEDIWAVRILAMEPFTDKGYGPSSHRKREFFFANHANERLRILGEIPLRKYTEDGSPVLDYTGAPDTSFLAKIPADTPYTFQTLDKNGSVLNMAQTWHQVRPGEVQANCGGCHAHSSAPVEFEQTAAAQIDYVVWDLSSTTPLLSQTVNDKPTLEHIDSPAVNVEFYQDIRPLLQGNCVSCHTKNSDMPPAQLVLDDYSVNQKTLLPNDYSRLCNDGRAKWGIPPVIKNDRWRNTNASRYVRKFQSRRSLLTWKLFGTRLDGWNNEDHPTESIPGDKSSLPEGAKQNNADLDYTGSIMPPVGSGKLTNDEKFTFVRWIDLGCPIDTSKGTEREGYGWFLDETKPTLTVTYPTAGKQQIVLSRLLVGITDAYSGIDLSSLSVTANFVIDNIPEGENLASAMTEISDGVYQLQLGKPISHLKNGRLNVTVKDLQGNITRVSRHFSIY